MLNPMLTLPDLGLMPAASLLSLDATIAGLALTLGLAVSALAVLALALVARRAQRSPAPEGGARSLQPAPAGARLADAHCS